MSKAAIKNLRRILKKKRRNLKLHLLKHGVLTWIEFFEGQLIFGPEPLVLNNNLIWICPIERWRDNGN